MSGNYRVWKGRACTLKCICEGPECWCALERIGFMAVWTASMTGTKASAWQWVMAQSKQGQQEVTNAHPVSTSMAEVRQRYSWQVKLFRNPGRKAKPMRCRENGQCSYRGASPLDTSHRNVPELRMNFTKSLSHSSQAHAPNLPVLQCHLSLSTHCPFPWIGN